VRIPFADTSTYPVPAATSDEEFLMLADILPTAYEVGVLNGRVSPGDVVAIVGAGSIGLSAIIGSHLFSPSHNGREDPVEVVQGLTDGLGADVASEAVGTPATFGWALK
jgi:alcohol dehydrogenase